MQNNWKNELSIFRLIVRDIIVTKINKIIVNNSVWVYITHASSQKWMHDEGKSSSKLKCTAKILNWVIPYVQRIILHFIPTKEAILKSENWDFSKQLGFSSFACMVYCKAPESCHSALTYFEACFILGWELWEHTLPQDSKKCPSLGLNQVSHRGTWWWIGLK